LIPKKERENQEKIKEVLVEFLKSNININQEEEMK